jgi:hypothetical protein
MIRVRADRTMRRARQGGVPVAPGVAREPGKPGVGRAEKRENSHTAWTEVSAT